MNKSMREDFEDAISQLGEEGEDQEIETASTESGETESHEQDEIRATTGEDDSEAESESGAEQQTGGNQELPEVEDKFIERPPISWSPANREKWKTLPREVREQIAKRERQIDLGLQDAAENRKAGQRFNEIANKYSAIIAAEGVTDPLSGFEGLMQNLAVLRVGSPQQKAEKIASFIANYGVSIEMLDSILVGQMPAQGRNSELEQMLDQRLQPMQQFLQQVNQARTQHAQRISQQADQELAQFADSHEFMQELGPIMADMLDAASRQGLHMTLEDAYNRAAWVHPEVSQVLYQRAAANPQATERKRAAASSISGTRAGAGGPAPSDSIRSAIESAWDAQND